ncbi:MAG: imidazole glycerol phosphate synthase subunit HisH [Dethiobacter sp.]|jgi:glutamine amidotransferase|nr:imidazole glycerol phosphate synthase subunit HisH [Dethiobacter sp.]
MIVIIDYGVGNLSSVKNGFAEAGFSTAVSSDPELIAAADGLVLPGVGAFGRAMENLRMGGLHSAVLSSVRRGVPLLGICVGMQMLFERSEEMGDFAGLGLIAGSVVQFNSGLKVPQVGWNQLVIRRSHPLLDGIKDGDYFYFVHSYHGLPATDVDLLATADYGLHFPAVVQKGNIYGVQFHPEKSSGLGLKILDNFGRLAAC